MESRVDSIKKISEMIKKVSVAMLVTSDAQGRLHSRPMTTQKMEFDGDVWFFVSSDAQLVGDIKKNPSVNIAYSEDGNYVSMTGQASIVTDIAKKKELWHPELKVWFEGKEPEAPEVMLVKVSASEADYWETGNGMVGNAIRTVIALITGESGSPIEDGHATFQNAESKVTSASNASKQSGNGSSTKASAQAEKATESKASAEKSSSTKASTSKASDSKASTTKKTGPTRKVSATKTSGESKKVSQTSSEGHKPDLSKQPNQGKPRKSETDKPKK